MDQPTPILPKDTIEWLNKLIMLAQWDKKLPFYIVLLVNDPAEYQAFLTRVRASATDKTQLTDSSTDTTPVVLARKKLLEAVAAVPALRELFGSAQDPFNGAPPAHLELLAEVSDVTAQSQKMVFSRNGTLEAVIAGMPQSGELNPDPLIVEDLNKFLTLIETEPAAANEKSIAELLYELATSPHWYIVMASLRASREYARDEEQAVVEALDRWKQIILKPTLKKLLAVHLSRASKKLIRLAWEQRELFAEARARIPENAREKNPDDERKQVAESALLLFNEKFKTQIDEIRSDLKVLATVGNHFISVRKFAKLDGFVYTWPEIARLGMANYKGLKYVEELFLNRRPRPEDSDLDAREVRELYSLIEKNDRLKRFMRLRPHFSQINENELMHYRPLAPVVVTAGRPGSEERVPVDFVPPQPQPSPEPPPPSPTKALQVQTLSIERAPDVPPSEHGKAYDLNFSRLGKTVKDQITVDPESLLGRILLAMGVSSDSGLQDTLKELFATDISLAEERIKRGGVELATRLLSPGVESLSQLLATPGSLRLVVNSPEKEIHYLPWEWWPTSQSTLLLSSPDQSVVRGFKAPPEALIRPMFLPFRLMSVIPNPPEGRRFTSDITVTALQELASAFGVEYRPVVREEASVENLQRHLDDFEPHVVHFEGYVEYGSSRTDSGDQPYDKGLHILLSESEGLTVEDFGARLRKNGVSLLVIGRNGVSRIYENACADAAFELAKQGLSVLAPMRALGETYATTFTTEFYREFLQGNKLESALQVARRNLASNRGDWTVFALFTDPDRLQYLEPIRGSA